MPLYEFSCTKCHTVFEELVRMGSTGEGLHCPACSAGRVRKLVSTFVGRTSSAGGHRNVGGGCGCGGNCGGGGCGGHCSCRH